VQADLETSLRRIVVGYRAIAAVWLLILAVITVRDPVTERPEIVWAVVGVVMVWSAVTIGASYRTPQVLSSWAFLVVDALIAAGTLIGPDLAGSANFYGGYPISAVVLSVFGRGLWMAVATVSVLSITAIWRLTQGANAGDVTVVSSTLLVYPFIAAPVIWGVGVLRRFQRLRNEAETALEQERGERIRAEERSEMAAHLHDSVLQTLALIQRSSGDKEAVVTLARGQERDLRTWLFGNRPSVIDRFEDAVVAMCAEVEESYQTPIEVVVVGDTEMTDQLQALLAAGREATINASRHADSPYISVYAELSDVKAELFVRDRGRGFDIDTVPEERQGIRSSIKDRMRRHGGEATIVSTSGVGTEVTLKMAL